MNISELKDKELDHAVAKALNWKLVTWGDRQVWVQNYGDGRWRCNEEDWKPSTNWNQGGPIIEQRNINFMATTTLPENGVYAWLPSYRDGALKGENHLIAAMRAFVSYIAKTNPEYFA